MDLKKKTALIKWLDALSKETVKSFEDLRDFRVITDILASVDLLSTDTLLNNVENRIKSLQGYIEGFYHQRLEEEHLISFKLLGGNEHGNVYEMEMGKLLLALLGCCIQDKARERFVESALKVDSQSQIEIKEMIESLIFAESIPHDFAEVLTRQTESSAPLDAAVFFKLVADGGVPCSPHVKGTSSPAVSRLSHEPVYAMYTNSPQGAANTSGINIRDISSPLRVMSLASPATTPLGALMHSPQLAQKIITREQETRRKFEALLRQKIQEYKKLDLAYQNEQHLRQDIQMDLEQRCKVILEKDARIQQLERQLASVHKMRDEIDELETLRLEKEKFTRDVRELQRRLEEQNDLKEQNQLLEREMSGFSQELATAKEQLKLMDLLKKTSEECRVQSHKHQLRSTELETSLEHCRQEVEQLRIQLEEAIHMRAVAQDQYKSLKKEKEELEELFAGGQVGAGNGFPVFAGETMNVVTEKRLSELQVEYDLLRSTWIDPIEHDSLKKQFHLEEEAKKVYEARYIEARKNQMSCEDTIEKLNSSVRQYKCQMEILESNLGQSEELCSSLRTQLNTLQESEEVLRRSEADLLRAKEKHQTVINTLQQELSKAQMEVQLAKQEADLLKEASESRRLTIMQLDQEKMVKTSAEQKLNNELKSCRAKIEKSESVQKELETGNLAYKYKVSCLESMLEKHESELAQKKCVIKNLEEKLLELNNRQAVLVSENEIASNTISRQNEEIQKYINSMEELNCTSEGLSEQLESAQQMCKGLEAERESLKENIKCNEERYLKELTQLKDESNSLKCQYSDDKEKLIQQLEELRNEAEQEREKANEERLSHEQEMFKLTSDYSCEVNELKEQLEQQLNEFTAAKSELQASIDQLQNDYAEQTMQKDSLAAEVNKLISDVKSKEEEYAVNLQSLKEELTSKCDADSASFNQQIQNLLNDLAIKSDQLKQEQDRHETEMAEVNSNHVSAMSVLRAELESQKNELDAEKRKLVEIIEQMQAELNNEKQTKEEKVNENKNLISSHKSQLTQLSEEHAHIVGELQSKICELNSNVELLRSDQSTQLTQLNEIIERKESERFELECSEMESKAKIESLVGQVEILKNVEQSLLESKTSLETDIMKLKELVQQSEHENRSLQESVREKDSELNEMVNEIQQLKETYEVAKRSLETLTTENTDIKSQLSAYKESTGSEISELKRKLTEGEAYWKSQCEQLEEEYARGTEEVRIAHEKQVEELEQCIADKDTYMNGQKDTYQLKVHQLEKTLHESVTELEKKKCEINTLQNEKETSRNELDSLNIKLEKLVEDNKREIEMLIGQYETQLEEQKSSLTSKHSELAAKSNSQYEEKVTKLQSELDEQRVNYQQMVSNMESKLGGEVNDLRGRLSQMKCQYEAIIEEKQKDMKKCTEEWQEKCEKLTLLKDFAEQQCTVGQEINAKLQSEMVAMSSKIGEYDKLMSETNVIQEDLNKKLSCGTEQNQKLEAELAECRESLASMEKEHSATLEELGKLREELSHEKGEREELCTQLEYTRERNDTLSAELSSQQQQLAAVEEEKRQLEEQMSRANDANRAKISQMEQQAERTRNLVEVEKEELERQLQSTQKCFDAIQKSELEFKQHVENLEQDVKRLTERNQELEQRLRAYLEQEHQMLEENQLQKNRSTELNKELQQQLREVKTLTDSSSKIKQELEISKQNLKDREAKFDKELRELRQDKTSLEIDNARLSKVEEQLQSTEAERKRLQEINDKYNIHYNKKKEIIAQHEELIKKQNQELDYYKRAEEKLTREYGPLNEKYNLEVAKNKKLLSQIRALETSNDLADRKIREYKQQLEKTGSVFLGDPSDFQRMIETRDSAEDASFMENHPPSVPLNSSIFEKGNDATLTPDTRNSRSRRRISKSVSSSTVTSVENEDAISIGSATSLAYRLRSRESAVSLNRSITSFDSCRSNASIPKGTGGLFHSEDEPMELDWDRIGEMSRRNTMCPSHLKTSYPVETQHYNPNKFQDDALRQSTINSHVLKRDQQPGSGRKRKQGWDSAESSSDSGDSKNSKHAKTGCVYQKPGPPTPANSRRNSKGSKSPSVRRNSDKGSSSRSPRTPLSLRGRRTPRRTPKQNTPVRGNGTYGQGSSGSGKKAGKRDSVAYNIGFSPLGHSNRLTRQQAFINKQPPSSTQTMNPQIRKPLGTRNFMQTGV